MNPFITVTVTHENGENVTDYSLTIPFANISGGIKESTVVAGKAEIQFYPNSRVDAGLMSVTTLEALATVTAQATLNGAPLASPAFTGVPTAPTASAGTNTTQLATTAFVHAQPTILGTASGTDTYAVTTTLAPTLGAGLRITVRFTNANTGAATLAYNGSPAVPIVKKDGTTAMSGGDIAANTYYDLMYISPIVGFVALGV